MATFSRGESVSWEYRSGIGHGTVVGLASRQPDKSDPLYAIREHDHHVGPTGSREPSVVYHHASNMRHSSSSKPHLSSPVKSIRKNLSR